MKLPNGPKTPGFIQIAQWILDPVGYMEETTKQYGDIFTTKVGATVGDGLVFVSDPQSLQQILTNDILTSRTHKPFAAPSKVNRIMTPLLGDYSVILLEGDRHKKRRQLLMPPFHGERMRSYGDIICRFTEDIMAEVPLNRTFTARSIMQSISLQVIMGTVFGLTEGKRYQQLKELLASSLEIFRFPIVSAVLLSLIHI